MHIKELVPTLARVSEKSESELIGLLSENAESEDGDWSVETVSKVVTNIISDHSKSILDDRKDSLFGEAFKKVNKKIKESYDVQTSLKDLDLVKHIIDLQVQKVKDDFEKSKETLTEENARENPIVKALLESKDSEIESKVEKAVEKLQSKLETAVAELQKTKQDSFVGSLYDTAIDAHRKAKSMIFDDKNTLIPEREQYIKDKIDLLMLKNKIRQSSDGAIEILDDKGELLRNDLHKPITYVDFIMSQNPFGVYEADPSKSSPKVDVNQKNQSTLKASNLAEAFEMVNKIQDDPNSTPEQKAKALSDFKAMRLAAQQA